MLNMIKLNRYKCTYVNNCFHSSQFSKTVDNFFEKVKEMDCYITGTNFQSSVKSGSCVCYNDYRGSDCGIPAKVRH